MRKLRMLCHKHKALIRAVIVLTVMGEAVCLIHAGYLEARYADAYLIGAGWLKDIVREVIAVKEEISA